MACNYVLFIHLSSSVSTESGVCRNPSIFKSHFRTQLLQVAFTKMSYLALVGVMSRSGASKSDGFRASPWRCQYFG